MTTNTVAAVRARTLLYTTLGGGSWQYFKVEDLHSQLDANEIFYEAIGSPSGDFSATIDSMNGAMDVYNRIFHTDGPITDDEPWTFAATDTDHPLIGHLSHEVRFITWEGDDYIGTLANLDVDGMAVIEDSGVVTDVIRATWIMECTTDGWMSR